MASGSGAAGDKMLPIPTPTVKVHEAQLSLPKPPTSSLTSPPCLEVPVLHEARPCEVALCTPRARSPLQIRGNFCDLNLLAYVSLFNTV